MPDKPISPLRQRMIDDMTARRFKEKVQKDYVRHVRTFAAFLGRSPDTATSEDLRRFQVHLAKQQIGVPTINAAIAALRFFFNVTLERPDLVRPLTTVNKPRKAPVVLSQEEVARLLEAAPGLKYKAALSVAYGAGLRVSEVVALKVSDIDSQRMTLRVEQGKGQRDRYVMLSPQLLELLREWWHAARPQAWLFPGQNPVNPMSARQLVRAVHAAAQAAGIAKRVSPHTLRHSFVPTTLAVRTDRRLMRRLLQNLVSNAIKYTLKGRVLVGCRRAGGAVRIEVWDTGLGIPADRQRAVFEEFRRLDQGARVARGLGLGLSIVERLSRVLDHPLGLDLRPGEGSVFFVTAPIGAAAPTRLTENGTPQPLPGGEPLAGLKVLAIDNEPRVLEGMRSLMSRWGCVIATAHGLAEARVRPRCQKSGGDDDRFGPTS